MNISGRGVRRDEEALGQLYVGSELAVRTTVLEYSLVRFTPHLHLKDPKCRISYFTLDTWSCTTLPGQDVRAVLLSALVGSGTKADRTLTHYSYYLICAKSDFSPLFWDGVS